MQTVLSKCLDSDGGGTTLTVIFEVIHEMIHWHVLMALDCPQDYFHNRTLQVPGQDLLIQIVFSPCIKIICDHRHTFENPRWFSTILWGKSVVSWLVQIGALMKSKHTGLGFFVIPEQAIHFISPQWQGMLYTSFHIIWLAL